MTKEEALEIVKDDGLKLKDLPDHFKKDKEIVLEAVTMGRYLRICR